mgnify:CR=1 FL=1
MSLDLSKTIAPKSDQLNADDMISGPRTITVTSVKLAAEDQPVSIHFVGDDGKPYKPCKSMRRVLVKAWGPDGAQYPGASSGHGQILSARVPPALVRHYLPAMDESDGG